MVSIKNIKKVALLFISLMVLSIMSIVVFAHSSGGSNPNWGQVESFFPQMPFASNGPSLQGDSCQKSLDSFYQGAVSGVCGATSTNPWDLGAAYVTQDSLRVMFKIVSATNFTTGHLCGGPKNLSLAIFVNSDGLTTTGNFFQNKPAGYDFVIYLNGSTFGGNPAALYQHNGTYTNQNGSNFNINSSGANTIMSNVTNCNGTSSTPSRVYLAILKSSFQDRPFSFNATFFVVSSNNPVTASTADSVRVELDRLGNGFGESVFKDAIGFNQTNFNPEFKFGCGQYAKTNATVCENNSAGDKCKWDNGFNDCFPTSFGDPGNTGLSCTQMCGECTTQPTCVNNTKCQWNTNMFNFKTKGTGACIEDPSKYMFKPGKNCDTSCGDCSSQTQCNSSSYPDPKGLGGKGCVWVNNTITNNAFCSLSTFDTSTFTCSANHLERCYTPATCTAVLGSWDGTYNFCKTSTGGAEVCFNGQDDDADGKIDCADSDCSTQTFCGGDISLVGGGFNTTDTFECMKQKYMKDYIVDSQPPVLASDPVDNTLVNNNTHLDITGLSVGQMGSSIMFGIGVKNVTPLATCGTTKGHQNNSANYMLFLDTDANSTTGCGFVMNGANKTGFEYYITVSSKYLGTNYSIVKTGYVCAPTGNFTLTPLRLPDPMEDGKAPNGIMSCRFDKVVTGAVLEDIGNPNKMRITVADFDYNTSTSAKPNDTLESVYFGSGQVDFKPTDCFSNPTACGSAFSTVGKGKFMPFQDCFSDLDTDGNGKAGCADPVCGSFPRCQSASNKYNASADTDPPTVISSSTYAFKSFVSFNLITDKPSNLSVTFYNQSSVCADSALNGTIVDNPPFASDNFRPFHGMPITNTTPKIGGIFGPGVTIFYKTTTCGMNGQCAVSGCSNFSVSAAAASENVSFKFELPANSTSNSLLGSLNIKIKNGTADISFSNGTVKNMASYIQNATIVIENTNQTSSPYSIEITGVDLTKTLSVNFTNAINATNFSSNGTFIGMGSDTWDELAQNTGAKTFKINITIYNYSNSVLNASQASPYNNFFKCASDNITSCTNVTDNVTKLGGGNISVSWVQWEVPSSLGFSVYGYGGAGNTGTSSGGSTPAASTGSSGGSKSSTTVVTTPVEAPVVEPTPVAPVAVTPKPAAVAPARQAPVVAPAPTQARSAVEVTNVQADGSVTKEQVKKSAKTSKDRAGKAFDQLFGTSGSGLGALIVLVLIVVIIVGVVYYKKKHE